jgi:hypothetical protein
MQNVNIYSLFWEITGGREEGSAFVVISLLTPASSGI